MQRPDRPPDISTLIQLPTPETMAKLHRAAESHADPDVRLLAAVVFRLCPAVEAIGGSLSAVARGDFVSLDGPDVQPKSPK